MQYLDARTPAERLSDAASTSITASACYEIRSCAIDAETTRSGLAIQGAPRKPYTGPRVVSLAKKKARRAQRAARKRQRNRKQ